MIQRYLGNKTSIIDPIIKEINKICEPGDLVCDIFSGTLAVSMALKRNGYRVISNDINKFSYSFGKSFLVNNTIPDFSFSKLGIDQDKYQVGIDEMLSNLKDAPGFRFLENVVHLKRYRKLTIVLHYLNLLKRTDLPKEFQKSYFFNTYTPSGRNSAFTSSRGTKGNRRFFTAENGKRIDLILNKIREWKQAGLLTETQYCLLVSIAAESIEKVSNTQGTFHDFPRTIFDSRATKKLFLRLPAMDDVISTHSDHILGKERDSLEFINEVPSHKLLYIDPPYNFRQYTSYYFMLNLICDYCEIKSLKDYFSNVDFVRGQNVEKEFTSTFCKSSQFIPSLGQLISDADADYVMMSYFNGRNHANNKIPVKDENGIQGIKDFFSGELFVKGSFRIKPITRLNYQSFNGHKAHELIEYLFIARKKN
jgi:adenine-specific DNA-methyltransferase